MLSRRLSTRAMPTPQRCEPCDVASSFAGERRGARPPTFQAAEPPQRGGMWIGVCRPRVPRQRLNALGRGVTLATWGADLCGILRLHEHRFNIAHEATAPHLNHRDFHA